MWQGRSGTPPLYRCYSWLAPLLTVFFMVLVLAGCGGNAAPESPQVIADKGTPFHDLLVAELQTSVKDGAVDVPVDKPITVSARDGVLGVVAMVNASGTAVKAELSPDGLTWSTAEPLGYNKQYTLTAEALGLGGVAQAHVTFETASPENLTMAYVLPNEGEVVGVGQPVAIKFDESIPNRLAAQRAITVTTDPPVEGAFYWLSDREVRWRPERFWTPGAKIEVSVNIYGVDLGDGLFGQDNLATQFTVGDQVISTIDDNTKTMTVRRNGEVIRSMPVSMGKNSTPTNNGTYLVGERFSHIVMDSSTYGVPVNSPDGYRTDVDWATQISYSGIFVHAAPWSVGSQGSSNVSHGCINVSSSNGQWFYNTSKRGDVVQISNTVGSTLPGVDGLGDWNIPWEQWRAGNASL